MESKQIFTDFVFTIFCTVIILMYIYSKFRYFSTDKNTRWKYTNTAPKQYLYILFDLICRVCVCVFLKLHFCISYIVFEVFIICICGLCVYHLYLQCLCIYLYLRSLCLSFVFAVSVYLFVFAVFVFIICICRYHSSAPVGYSVHQRFRFL